MFRFTIRELVLLTLIVAMSVGWWLDHRSLAPDAELHRRLRERASAAYREQMKRNEAIFQNSRSIENSIKITAGSEAAIGLRDENSN